MTGRMRFVFLALIALAAAIATAAVVVLTQTRGPAPAVGGDFTLLDENGRTVTAADFNGRYRLMFFGFIRCPDVCPTTLQKIADALAAAPQLKDKLNVVLVTVDPERDRPEDMKAYVTYFDPAFRGLTGTPQQIEAMLKAYGVYAQKVTIEGSAMDYTMDHSGFLFLYGPKGEFVTTLEPTLSVEALAAKLGETIR